MRYAASFAVGYVSAMLDNVGALTLRNAVGRLARDRAGHMDGFDLFYTHRARA
jgi:hypothetical protein